MQDHRSACSSPFWRRACLHCDGAHLAFISHISSEDNPVYGNELEVRLRSPFKKPSIVMITVTTHCQTRHHESRVTFAVGALLWLRAGCELANSLHEITYSQHAIKMLISRHVDYKTRYLVFTLCDIQAILFIPHFLSWTRS